MALTVGLAGAGPWAAAVHGPTLAAGPETRLAGVWSRRPESAAAVAEPLGVPVFTHFDELVAASEAVALAVPPSVQPDLAVRAARAGRAVLLEKPLADTVAGAEAIAAAVAEAAVPTMMLLTYRFAEPVRQFLARTATFEAHGGRAAFVSGAFLSESTATAGGPSGAPSSTSARTSSTSSTPPSVPSSPWTPGATSTRG